MTHARRAAALAAALLAGCELGPAPPTDWGWYAAANDAELASFGDARSLLDGFDAPRPGESVATGDCALFGLRLLDRDERREWFLRVTATNDEPAYGAMQTFRVARDSPIALRLFGPPTEPHDREVEIEVPLFCRLRIEVFDARLERIADEQLAMGRNFFDGALLGCLEATLLPPLPARSLLDPPTLATRAQYAVGDVVHIVRETRPLLAILREIARLPPLWTLLRGVRVSHGISMQRAVAEPTRDGALAFAFPLRVLINQRPALLCTVTAVDPSPPLRVCGGFTRLVASDPEVPERRVVLTLLAARCGDANANDTTGREPTRR